MNIRNAVIIEAIFFNTRSHISVNSLFLTRTGLHKLLNKIIHEAIRLNLPR